MPFKHFVIAATAALLFSGSPSPVTAQTVDGCGTAAIGKTEGNDRARLGKNADCFAKARTLATAAEAVRRDRIVAIMAAPVPAPGSSPTPAPSPVFTPVPSPSLEGLAPVASGIKVADYVWPAWGNGAIPGPEGENEGAFRFICAPSHNAYDDPIIYPGQPGRSHLHTFFGNDKANARSTYASLRTTGGSTCNTLLNRSAYWIAAMMNGHGKIVMPDYLGVYYKRPASTTKYCKPPFATACLPLPRGLRYIFGYNMLNPAKSDPAGMRWWNCDGPGAVPGHFATLTEAAKGCPVGARLGAIVVGPDCWNGRDLDSPDHRSHMAYQAQDGFGRAICPKTHAYLLPHFQLGAWYSVDATLKDWYIASDRMAGMAEQVPGTTLHSDWFGAWEDSVMDRWMGHCIEKLLSCSGGDLGDGWQMATTKGYDWPNGRPLQTPPAMPTMPAMAHTPG